MLRFTSSSAGLAAQSLGLRLHEPEKLRLDLPDPPAAQDRARTKACEVATRRSSPLRWERLGYLPVNKRIPVMLRKSEITLREGNQAPAFRAPSNGGGHVALSDFAGRHIVLCFYPKDDTPGRTKEACGFRDHFEKLKKQGAVVRGVSVDSVKAHDRFAAKYALPFPLVSDADRKIVQA
jgi:hypothetical protein